MSVELKEGRKRMKERTRAFFLPFNVSVYGRVFVTPYFDDINGE